MRTWRILQTLSDSFATHFLLIDKVGWSPDNSSALKLVKSNLASFHLFRLSTYETADHGVAPGHIKGDWAKIREHVFGRPFRAAAFPPNLVADVARVIDETDFDVVMFLRLYSGVLLLEPLVQRAIGNHPIVFDQDDIDSDYLNRERVQLKAKIGHVMKFLRWIDVRKIRSLEQAIWRRTCCVFVCSEIDAAKIAKRAPGANCKVLPNVVEVNHSHLPTPKAQGRNKVILFVGTLSYGPNSDAIVYFCEKIFEQVQRPLKTAVTLRVVGVGASEEVNRLADRSGVDVLGFVDDIADAYRDVDLAIVPIRYGAGTRIKILEAFAFGVPVVSTSIGAEGLEIEDGVHLLLADGASEFASACARLLSEKELSTALVNHGRKLVEERYSEATVQEVLAAGIQSAHSDR